MSDLDRREQAHVRTMLRVLRRRVGSWGPVAQALRFEYDSVEKVVNGRRTVTASMAIRVARLAGLSIDDLLAGRFQPACPRCGHVPDFADEPTVVEDAPRSAPSGALKLMK